MKATHNTAQPGHVLKAKNVDKWFGHGLKKNVVLDNVNVEARPGEVLAISGPSGAGKTTLLHILAGIDRANRGHVQSAGRIDRGFIFQDYNLLESLNASHNALLAARLQGTRPSKKQLRAVFEELGLKGLESRLPHELSGGQQQRVAVARVLLAGNSFIFADEPTGALDSESSAMVLNQLRTVANHGATVVLVSHSHAAIKVADRHIVLQPAVAGQDGERSCR